MSIYFTGFDACISVVRLNRYVIMSISFRRI